MCTTIYNTLKCILSYFDYECSVYLHSLNKVKSLYLVCLSEFILPRLTYLCTTSLPQVHTGAYGICVRCACLPQLQLLRVLTWWSTCLSLPQDSGKHNSIQPSDTWAAYCLPHFDHISHWRQVEAWKTHCMELVALWKHISSLVACEQFGDSAVKFWWHWSFYGQVWWSFGSAEVRCHGWVVWDWGWGVCKSSVVFRLQQEAGL